MNSGFLPAITCIRGVKMLSKINPVDDLPIPYRLNKEHLKNPAAYGYLFVTF